ncbi:DUF305 domain-containing protein [Acerihabitans sp. TG2]|uniref:CopM family metallochaperone n=1 Tax=Acerihabitans sp. TG2 TaxID=3096008 RepID=UPI002B22C8F2|nr:DUF305 domain-containing protein [Acerihabitans sp. TG2]MEA9390231.1 DUF305 domain-containing protein [Acerihabitans sp. TG2]
MNKKMLLFAAALLSPLVALAADQNTQMSNQGSMSPATQEYMSGMQSMHDNMMAGVMSSNPDVAFAKGMTAHHQGAIDMAKTELKYGKDPEMRKLAKDIIKAQQPEIDQMQMWVKKHGQQ